MQFDFVLLCGFCLSSYFKCDKLSAPTHTHTHTDWINNTYMCVCVPVCMKSEICLHFYKHRRVIDARQEGALYALNLPLPHSQADKPQSGKQTHIYTNIYICIHNFHSELGCICSRVLNFYYFCPLRT